MRGMIREHKVFSGHGMRGPAETGRGGIPMAGWRHSQGAGKGKGPSLAVTAMFFVGIYRCISVFCLDEGGGCQRIFVRYTHILEF